MALDLANFDQALLKIPDQKNQAHLSEQKDAQALQIKLMENCVNQTDHARDLFQLMKRKRSTCGSEFAGCPAIRRFPELTRKAFLKHFHNRLPIIVKSCCNLRLDPANFSSHGPIEVLLSTMEQEAYKTCKIAFLSDYLDSLQSSATKSNSRGDELYLLQDGGALLAKHPTIVRGYRVPCVFHTHSPCSCTSSPHLSLQRARATEPLAHTDPVLGFGLAGQGGGLPFHRHNEVVNETIVGVKIWFLSRTRPQGVCPTHTHYQWVTEVLPNLDAHARKQVWVGEVREGEAIYVPEGWYHAVLNKGVVVSVSSVAPNQMVRKIERNKNKERIRRSVTSPYTSPHASFFHLLSLSLCIACPCRTVHFSIVWRAWEQRGLSADHGWH